MGSLRLQRRESNLSMKGCSFNLVNKGFSKYSFDFSLTVEKTSLGWKITTTLIYNGNGWLYVEKNGYGDIGCIIYDENDNEVWRTYFPEDGNHWGIGAGGKYESMTIWIGRDPDGNKVPDGGYKIVGASGYFEDDEYIPLLTEPYSIRGTVKEKQFLHFYDHNLMGFVNNYFLMLKEIIFA